MKDDCRAHVADIWQHICFNQIIVINVEIFINESFYPWLRMGKLSMYQRNPVEMPDISGLEPDQQALVRRGFAAVDDLSTRCRGREKKPIYLTAFYIPKVRAFAQKVPIEPHRATQYLESVIHTIEGMTCTDLINRHDRYHTGMLSNIF